MAEKIKNRTNRSFTGELNFSNARLSFLNHFPSLTRTLYDFTLKGSAPFKKDTLIAANEIALGINIKSLVFNKHINIDKIFIADAFMNVQANEKGEANYNVYADNKKKAASNTDTTGTTLHLEKIIVENSHLVYNDKSVDILINAKGCNYTGNGDLSEAVFDLYSHAKVDSLDFYFSREPYLLNKKINADLITKINTARLLSFFKKIPWSFTGCPFFSAVSWISLKTATTLISQSIPKKANSGILLQHCHRNTLAGSSMQKKVLEIFY